jgi:hypothetical protein
MLMYGDANGALCAIQNNKEKLDVLNLTSLNEKFTDRLFLVPPNALGANSEYDFDVKYMHWIMDDNRNFIQLMRIINDIVSGMNVYIVISLDEWSEVLIDSLMKLIQQRYGINGCRVIDIDDLINAEESGFEDYGIYNYNEDRLRFEYIMESQRILAGGQVSEQY